MNGVFTTIQWRRSLYSPFTFEEVRVRYARAPILAEGETSLNDPYAPIQGIHYHGATTRVSQVVTSEETPLQADAISAESKILSTWEEEVLNIGGQHGWGTINEAVSTSSQDVQVPLNSKIRFVFSFFNNLGSVDT
jgi:hypothetical protein